MMMFWCQTLISRVWPQCLLVCCAELTGRLRDTEAAPALSQGSPCWSGLSLRLMSPGHYNDHLITFKMRIITLISLVLSFIALVLFMGCLVASLACFSSDFTSFTRMNITIHHFMMVNDHLMSGPPSVAASATPDRGTTRVRHQRRAWAEKKNG